MKCREPKSSDKVSYDITFFLCTELFESFGEGRRNYNLMSPNLMLYAVILLFFLLATVIDLYKVYVVWLFTCVFVTMVVLCLCLKWSLCCCLAQETLEKKKFNHTVRSYR